MDHASPAQSAPRVALLGLGTVGSAVAARLLDPDWQAGLEARNAPVPRLVAVAVRDLERTRQTALPDEVRVSDDPASVVAADDVDIVIELIGGTDVAADAVRQAIAAGKSVVTANKGLLAREGRDLESAARAAGVALRFEAAVAGGLPVLAPLVRDLAADRIVSIRGIINGTTNHVLSTMAMDAREYEEVLREAQSRGYTEADPSGDVEGRDAANKLAILVRLAFGGWPDVDALRRDVPTLGREPAPGITGVTRAELSAARRLGLAIKMVARARRGPAGTIIAAVTPMAVGSTTVLGATSGITNVVEIDADPVGRVSVRGPGAGGPATASAVLADVLAVALGAGSTWGHLPPGSDAPIDDDLSHEQGWFCAVPGVGSQGFPAPLRELALVTTDEGFVTPPVTLAALLPRLASLEASAVFYPILADT